MEHQNEVALRHLHVDFDVKTGRATYDMRRERVRRGEYDIPAQKALKPRVLDSNVTKGFKVRWPGQTYEKFGRTYVAGTEDEDAPDMVPSGCTRRLARAASASASLET